MALKSKSLDLVRPTVPAAAAAKDEEVRVNINVPKAVRTAWKSAALARDKTLTELIVDSMSNYLNTPLNK